jgi:hypothetical protein
MKINLFVILNLVQNLIVSSSYKPWRSRNKFGMTIVGQANPESFRGCGYHCRTACRDRSASKLKIKQRIEGRVLECVLTYGLISNYVKQSHFRSQQTTVPSTYFRTISCKKVYAFMIPESFRDGKALPATHYSPTAWPASLYNPTLPPLI